MDGTQVAQRGNLASCLLVPSPQSTSRTPACPSSAAMQLTFLCCVGAPLEEPSHVIDIPVEAGGEPFRPARRALPEAVPSSCSPGAFVAKGGKEGGGGVGPVCEG